MANFSNLEILDLSGNAFTGSICPYIGALSSLKALSLSSINGLNGTLPTQGENLVWNRTFTILLVLLVFINFWSKWKYPLKALSLYIVGVSNEWVWASNKWVRSLKTNCSFKPFSQSMYYSYPTQLSKVKPNPPIYPTILCMYMVKIS